MRRRTTNAAEKEGLSRDMPRRHTHCLRCKWMRKEQLLHPGPLLTTHGNHSEVFLGKSHPLHIPPCPFCVWGPETPREMSSHFSWNCTSSHYPDPFFPPKSVGFSRNGEGTLRSTFIVSSGTGIPGRPDHEM